MQNDRPHGFNEANDRLIRVPGAGFLLVDFEILWKNLWLCSARRDLGYHYSMVLIVVLFLQPQIIIDQNSVRIRCIALTSTSN